MKIPYEIHRLSSHPRPRVVEIEGEQETVTRDQIEIECVPLEGDHGTIVIRLFGIAAVEAKETFRQGAKVVLSLEPEE